MDDHWTLFRTLVVVVIVIVVIDIIIIIIGPCRAVGRLH